MDRQPSGRPGLALPFCSRSSEKGPSEGEHYDHSLCAGGLFNGQRCYCKAGKKRVKRQWDGFLPSHPSDWLPMLQRGGDKMDKDQKLSAEEYNHKNNVTFSSDTKTAPSGPFSYGVFECRVLRHSCRSLVIRECRFVAESCLSWSPHERCFLCAGNVRSSR